MTAHDICKLAPTTNGLVVTNCGSDPYLNGQARDYPLLWLKLRLKSDQSGMAQMFYFPAQGSPTEASSVRFSVPGGDWSDVRVQMPALSTQTRLRFDPPGIGGTCVLARISFDLRPVFQQPAWPRPVPPIIASNAPCVTAGELSLAHDSTSLGAFEVRVNGQSVAIGNTRSFVGYLSGPMPRWFAVTNSTTVELDIFLPLLTLLPG